MMKKIFFGLLFFFALLTGVKATNDSIFIQLKSGELLAYEYLEYDTVSVNERYIYVADTMFHSANVSRIVFNREMLKKETGVQFVAFKLRATDAANESLMGRTFTADIDELSSADTIRFNIPYLTNFKLAPYFVANSQKVKVSIDGKEIVSVDSIVDFSNPVRMKLEYEGGATREYVIVIKNSGLPIVVIDTEGRRLINSKTEWAERSTMVVYNADGSVNYDSGTDFMNIRGRGNSTWSYSKKPYNIKLNVKKSILGMPKHKRWCLLANYIDRTLMRNAVAFELARMTSMDWTPNGRFVELVLNGEPVGNYYLCEAIRIDKNRVNINEMSPYAISGEDITGGYILELDSYYDAEWKFKTSYYRMPVNVKQPDDDEMNSYQHSYIKDYYNKAERELYNGSIEGFAQYVDMNSLIDWYLLNEAIYNPELNHPKSSYMHKDKNGKLFMGPAWDHDWETFTPHSSLKNNNSMWFGALFSHPEFKQMVKERWKVLKGPFTTISRYIEELRESNRASWEFNNKLWPRISNSVNGDTSMPYDAAVDRLKNAFLNRVNSLNSIINSW
jgi:hypothetical protein